jgi:sugar fermentation stimulation protein A
MKFKLPILRGILLRRYKRFLADVQLDTGAVVLAHCPNTGSMLTCSEPGRPVLVSYHGENCGRKLLYTLEAIRMGNHWVGVNTMNPNRAVAEAVSSGAIPELAGYATLQREVKYGRNSRIDLFLSGHARRTENCLVEIKNTTYRDGDGALYPDAVTARGLKHIQELTRAAKTGHRAAFFFFVGRSDCEWMSVADKIDPAYSTALRRAVDKGHLEVYAYRARISATGIAIEKRLPVRL